MKDRYFQWSQSSSYVPVYLYTAHNNRSVVNGNDVDKRAYLSLKWSLKIQYKKKSYKKKSAQLRIGYLVKIRVVYVKICFK